MTTTTTTLPNGYVIEGIPDGTTREQVREMSLKQGTATEEEWDEWAPELTPWTTDVSNWMSENAEIPAGVGGAVGLGLLGTAVAGPVGGVVGAIVGGMTGSAGGSLLSDHLAGEDLDYGTAALEGAISLGLDVATLGAGKAIKPLVAFIKSKKASGLSPQQTADALVQQARTGSDMGSDESLKATQKFLTGEGATLTPFQTGNATGSQLFSQKLAESGILSRNTMLDNANNVDKAVNSAFEEIVSRSGHVDGLDPSAIGHAIYGVIDEGRKALSKSYGEGLDRITGNLAGKVAPVAPVRLSLEKFIKSFDSELGSSLDPQASKIADEFLSNLKELNVTNTKSLISFEKTFNSRMSALSDVNSGQYNSTASRQLAQLSESLHSSVELSLRAVDKKAADAYKALNNSYRTGISALLPKITSGSMKSAKKGDFTALGRAVLNEGSLDATRALYKSIDQAFVQIGGGTLEFASAAEVKATIRNGFLKELLPSLGSDFSIASYKNLAKRFSTPKQKARLAMIMGDNYKSVKQLLNVMEESAKKPSSNMGELALRAKEFAAAGAIVGGGIMADATLESLALGSMVFLIPSFLAKAAVNPKNVNKILAFQKKDFKGNQKAMFLAATNVIEDVVLEMTEDERKALGTELNSMLFKDK
jgi:hypothetical protein